MSQHPSFFLTYIHMFDAPQTSSQHILDLVLMAGFSKAGNGGGVEVKRRFVKTIS